MRHAPGLQHVATGTGQDLRIANPESHPTFENIRVLILPFMKVWGRKDPWLDRVLDNRNCCQDAGVVPSLGSRGDCDDNAITESFFATLECELLDRSTFRTYTQARTAIFDYLEGFYNTHRRHSALGYRSPAAFERQCAREQVA